MPKDSKLNVFGDSYSTPGFCVEPSDSFWGLMAQDLGIDMIYNYSHPGFSLDHIIHILLNESFDFSRDYFCIGIPPLVRYIGYDDKSNQSWHGKKIDINLSIEEKIIISSIENTVILNFRDVYDNHPTILDKFSSEWHDVQSLEKIFLLANYLKTKSAKFLLLNLSNPICYQDLWPAGKGIMAKVAELPECVIFDNTYYSTNFQDKIKPIDYDAHGWQGHHGLEGNSNWYNRIIKNKMSELGWI